MKTEAMEAPELDARTGPWLAELFHALNQPITALHCSFELALYAPRSETEYRSYLMAGLDNAAQMASLASGIRELLEAAECGVAFTAVSLQKYVNEAVEHFLPVANDAGTAITLHCEGHSRALFDPERLRRVLFYLFDVSLPFACGEVLAVQVRESDSQAILEFTCKIPAGGTQEFLPQVFSGIREFSLQEHHWKQRLKWMIAQQLLRSGKGSLITRSEKKLHIEARLPLCQNDAPVAGGSGQEA